MDTKWHFCIVDTDHGVGLNSTLDTDLFGVINDGSILGAVVNHPMQNNSFRERFILRFVWCTEIYFQPDRLVAELDALIARITPVMQLQLSRWRVTDGSMTTYETWWSYIEVIRNFVTNRPAYARRQLMSWAGLDDAAYGSYKARALRMWGNRSGADVFIFRMTWICGHKEGKNIWNARLCMTGYMPAGWAKTSAVRWEHRWRAVRRSCTWIGTPGSTRTAHCRMMTSTCSWSICTRWSRRSPPGSGGHRRRVDGTRLLPVG